MIQQGECNTCGVGTYNKRVKRPDGGIYALCNKCSSAAYEASKNRRALFDKNKALRAQVFAKFDRCQNCGTTDNLTIDHIIPISKGGTDDIENLAVLCGTCNRIKGAK